MNDKFAQAQQDSESAQDVFRRRLGGSPAYGDSAPETAAANAYVPFGLPMEGRDEEGLTFYHEDGTITVKFYAHLTDIMSTSPQYLTLIYMDCMYTIKGRNLLELIPLIKRRKLDSIQCFDPHEYPTPLKGPVIYTITRENPRDMAEQA